MRRLWWDRWGSKPISEGGGLSGPWEVERVDGKSYYEECQCGNWLGPKNTGGGFFFFLIFKLILNYVYMI